METELDKAKKEIEYLKDLLHFNGYGLLCNNLECSCYECLDASCMCGLRNTGKTPDDQPTDIELWQAVAMHEHMIWCIDEDEECDHGHYLETVRQWCRLEALQVDDKE